MERNRKRRTDWSCLVPWVLLVLIVAVFALQITLRLEQAALNEQLDGLALEISSQKEAAIEPEKFDTQILEQWCGGDEGKIRMTGAWKYGEGADGIILCDETGELWGVGDMEISDTDFCLLWIADNNSENVQDDIVVKVWVESYEAVG